jgi:restriction endonuclease S subunit
MIKAIQELSAQNKAQAAQIDELKQQIQSLMQIYVSTT